MPVFWRWKIRQMNEWLKGGMSSVGKTLKNTFAVFEVFRGQSQRDVE